MELGAEDIDAPSLASEVEDIDGDSTLLRGPLLLPQPPTRSAHRPPRPSRSRPVTLRHTSITPPSRPITRRRSSVRGAPHHRQRVPRHHRQRLPPEDPKEKRLHRPRRGPGVAPPPWRSRSSSAPSVRRAPRHAPPRRPRSPCAPPSPGARPSPRAECPGASLAGDTAPRSTTEELPVALDTSGRCVAPVCPVVSGRVRPRVRRGCVYVL